MEAYEVWTEGTGDIFKGYNNDYHGTFKSEAKANEFAKSIGGWVETVHNNYHPEYQFED